MLGVYCFFASRLVIRKKMSPVWPGARLPSQFEERAGGFLARKQFFIAVSKREYYAELAAVILSLNICLFYWVEYEPVFAVLAVITDVYVLFFAVCAFITNIPIRHSEGVCVGQGIMLYKKGLTREYIAILKMNTLDIDVETELKEGDAKNARMENVMGFFSHQWYYILAQIRAFVSLDVIINEGSYEAFLVIRKKTVLTPSRTSLAGMNAAIKHITTSVNSELDCRLDILPHEQFLDVMGKMQFDIPVPRRIEATLLTRLTEPALIDTAFATQNGFVTFLKLEIVKYVRSHPSQRINESIRLDRLIKALITEKITARYMFSFKHSGIEKIDLREMGNAEETTTAKVRDGFVEIARNFEYLITSARISAGLFIFSSTKEAHADVVEKAIGILHSTWETDTRFERNPVTIAMDLACNGVESLIYHIPCFTLYRFFHFPMVPSGKQERRFQFQLDPPPDSVVNGGMLNIGKITGPNGTSKDFMLSIDDMKRHVFINGTTGSGKSVFTRNLIEQLIEHFPAIPFLVLELKGEYVMLGKKYPGVRFLEPGINFSMNIFDPIVDVHVHAERVFDILKTSFDFSDMKDFSPQMEKVLVDLIVTTCSDLDPARRCFAAFFQNAQVYVNDNKAKIPYLESTWIGIENRLRRITTGPLRSVFEGQQTQDPTSTIMKSRSIISLSNIISLGGTKDDLYFVANLILKMVWDANITRGPAKSISHITLVDDAQYFSRTRGSSPVRETNFLEDIALLLRGTGEVLVAISTRPDISEDVLSNCGLIVCFQTKFKEDVQKLKGLLHLTDDKASNLEILPEHTSIIKLNSYPSPFTLETKKPFILEQEAKGSREPDDLTNHRGESHKERSMPKDYAIYSQFFSKAKLYFQFKDHAWGNYSTLSPSEMDDLDKRIQALHDEIGAMMYNNQEIGVLVQKARASKSSDVLLRKIYDDFVE